MAYRDNAVTFTLSVTCKSRNKNNVDGPSKSSYGLAATFCLSALAYAGDDTAPEEAWSQIGFAIAAVKACPKVQINSDGMKDLTDSLDSEDQAKVFTDSTGVEKATNQADKTFVLAGDRACDIAFDHMNKSKFKLLAPAN